jgi:hypothetical protein
MRVLRVAPAVGPVAPVGPRTVVAKNVHRWPCAPVPADGRPATGVPEPRASPGLVTGACLLVTRPS